MGFADTVVPWRASASFSFLTSEFGLAVTWPWAFPNWFNVVPIYGCLHVFLLASLIYFTGSFYILDTNS